MPVYRLIDVPVFPDPLEADESGLIAVGGDLSIPRLLQAYRAGIFPWFEEGQPLLWWSPDPRLVLEPANLKVSRSLRKVMRRGHFEIRLDTAFSQVIRACASVREETGEGTWITPEMEKAYNRLYDLGFAHSVEVWLEGALVGGLYGVYMGRAFFGESMFSKVSDASKVALVALVEYLKPQQLELLDCQVTTAHLVSMGATEIPRAEFLRRLKKALRHPADRRRWSWPPPGGAGDLFPGSS